MMNCENCIHFGFARSQSAPNGYKPWCQHRYIEPTFDDDIICPEFTSNKESTDDQTGKNMMPDVLNIANFVTAELSSYDAEMLFIPKYELHDREEMKVCVTPLTVQYNTISTNMNEEVLKVQIRFLKRANEDELEKLLSTVEAIGLGFLGKTIAGSICIGVAYDPIYSLENLRENRQFTSSIELTFRKEME